MVPTGIGWRLTATQCYGLKEYMCTAVTAAVATGSRVCGGGPSDVPMCSASLAPEPPSDALSYHGPFSTRSRHPMQAPPGAPPHLHTTHGGTVQHTNGPGATHRKQQHCLNPIPVAQNTLHAEPHPDHLQAINYTTGMQLPTPTPSPTPHLG